MARITYNFKETGIDAISLAGRTRLGRVQSSDVGANLPNTPIQELGSNKLVGRIFDIPEVTASISSIDVGPKTAFMLAGKDWATAAQGEYIELQDIDYVCLAQTFKSESNDDIARTLFIPGAKLDSLSMNYSVGGDATEDFSFMGTTTKWLRYDVALASGVTTASGTLDLGATARLLKDGRYFLSAFAQGTGYLPNEAITSSAPGGVAFDTDVVPAGTFVVVAYHADLSNQWDYTYEYPNIAPGVDTPDQPVGIRGWGIEIYLVKSGVSNERIYRAQSCSIQGQLQTTKIQELGNEEVVGYSDGIPEVTGTIELMLHDFKLQEMLSGDDDSTDDNWNPNELGAGNWGLEVRMWRRNADRINGTPEKTIWVPEMDITQEQNRSQVGQDSSQTFNWASRTGQVFIYKGFRA